MSFDKSGKNTGTRRKARESALQMMFSADVIHADSEVLTVDYWKELGDEDADEKTQQFANNLVSGALSNLQVIDDRIRTRAEHWRIERMAIVDRNVLRLAVYEFLFEDTPHTVVINEALEIARRFSTFEATQFINGILDSIKLDLEKASGIDTPESKKKTQSSAT
ncbi:MAG: transcription antitermination factor NusB [Acidobacteria bacterium]|nr:transcription antitermination factor NusB [Acidobacteriota bacterium]